MDEETDIAGDVPHEKIEQDIAQTREEMGATVDEIKERLTASHLKEQAKDRIQKTADAKINRLKGAASRMGQSISSRAHIFGQTAKETGSTVMTSVRNNPVPLVMIGAGVAWLVFNKTRGKEIVMEKGSALKEQAVDLTIQAQERASELTGQMKEKGSEFAGKAGQSMVMLSKAARERAQSASSMFRQTMEQSPVGMALAAFGVGALLGFTIPESRKELEMMGPASESLLSKAKETAQKALHKAQHAAEQAVHTAEEEFKKSAA